MLAFMLLLLPLRWFVAALLAAVFHEFCHFAAIRFLGGERVNIRLYSIGARMPLPDMSRGRELLCALSGPAGGLVLTLLAPIFPRLAVCAFFQSVYNLLPIYPMDGGRVVGCLLSMILSPLKAAAVQRWIEIFTRSSILLAGSYSCFYLKLGFLPLIMSLLICIRIK